MGKHTSNYEVTPEFVVRGIKQCCQKFAFKPIDDNTYIRKIEEEMDAYLIFMNDYLTFFNSHTSVTYTYEEICDAIKDGQYNERTLFNKVLAILKEE